MATCFEDCLCSVIEDGQSCTQISPTLLSASPSPSPFSHASESPTVEDTEYGKSPSPFSYSAESPTVEDAMYERSHSPISYVTESPTDEVTAYGSDVWYGACQISQRQKTLWYHLSGNDDSECVPARLGGRYATIAVFSGECGDLSCVGESSYDNNGDQELVWEAKGGVAYHVVVRETQTSYGSNAEFSLEVEAVPCLQNDSCEASTIIASLPFVDVTSNELASREAGTSVRSCSQYSSDSRGVWYSVIGTGECLREVPRQSGTLPGRRPAGVSNACGRGKLTNRRLRRHRNGGRNDVAPAPFFATPISRCDAFQVNGLEQLSRLEGELV
eukprot:scaffold1351_cov176-Amphora_coffeaeformis.AAC.41